MVSIPFHCWIHVYCALHYLVLLFGLAYSAITVEMMIETEISKQQLLVSYELKGIYFKKEKKWPCDV